ncbi:Exosome complex component RRP45B [Linum perenne]
MDSRLANTWRLTVNEKKFIETALASDLRIDGRNPLEYRKLTIKFGREDGSSEVQLGHTHVMGFVSGQLVQPYRDRPNEGTLSIFTEFSPMADPSFEVGRPGESAIELGRIIDRGLRESKAVDMESLCVLPGKLVWAIRIDIHILDNGGLALFPMRLLVILDMLLVMAMPSNLIFVNSNLVDAANIAALAALLTFRRPECSLSGENGQEVVVHPPEVKEPLPLIVHHIPIAVTFAFFSTEHIVAVDPTHSEEAVMGGRMTVTVNATGDICAIQKAGGLGVPQSDIMRCLRLASRNAESITKKIKDSVEVYNTERALRKIKRHSTPIAANVSVDNDNVKNKLPEQRVHELSTAQMEKLKLKPEEITNENDDSDHHTRSSEQAGSRHTKANASIFLGGPSSWDPHTQGVDPDFLKASLASQGKSNSKTEENSGDSDTDIAMQEKPSEDAEPGSLASDSSEPVAAEAGRVKTLKDAVKPKNKRRKRGSSNKNAS